jgi:nucleoside-diphosphate-sugar epimerase
MSRPSAFVTGHQGFVGRHLVPKLRAAGYDVVGTEAFGLANAPFDPSQWDVIVHLAANIVNVDDRLKGGMHAYADLNLDYEMCSYVQEHPPKRAFVVMSSCAVDYPDDPYCIVKRTLEAMATTLYLRGVPVVVVRPFSGYGADQSTEYPFRAILERALRREDPLTVWGSGYQIRDWLHIDDLTDAILWAAKGEHLGGPWEIGTGVGTPMAGLASMIAAAVGYSPLVQGDFSKAASSGCRIADATAAAVMGWRAKIALKDGIASALAKRLKSNHPIE